MLTRSLRGVKHRSRSCCCGYPPAHCHRGPDVTPRETFGTFHQCSVLISVLLIFFIRRTSGRNMGKLKRNHADVTKVSSFYANLVTKCLNFATVPFMHTQEYGHCIRNCWPGQTQVIACLLTPWFFNNGTSINHVKFTDGYWMVFVLK
jgi:hypothetical protein